MSGDIAISVQNVSKAYRIWRDPSARLKAPLWDTVGTLIPKKLRPKALQDRLAHETHSRYYKEFYALKDVSFEVKKGEAVGIIGRNGSGKSTLLQIITGTLAATRGHVHVKGRVAALLELGSGFNPEFTGRENVFLNAGILGLGRNETEAKFDEIVRFSEIGDFIDQPVKTYSSGMVVRLAFAVAAHVEPDVLIVDEALAVGDARFQLKCARAIDRFIERGVTLLFVSHDASLVKRLCGRALLLDGGRLLHSGPPNDIFNLYSKLIADEGGPESIAADIAHLAAAPTSPIKTPPPATQTEITPEPQSVVLLEDERAHVPGSGREFAYGGELGRIIRITPLDASGAPRLAYTSGEEIALHMIAEADVSVEAPIFALTLKNTSGVEIYGTNTLFSRQPAPPLPARRRVEVVFRFPLNIMPGSYFLSFGFVHFVGEKLVVIQRRYDALKIDVIGSDRSFGIANLHARISCNLHPNP